MGVFKDITGTRIGMLVAVRFIEQRTCKSAPSRPINKKSYWLFQCDCGGTSEIDIGTFLSGRVRSCGCRGYKEWESNFNTLYKETHWKAKKRGLEWRITKEQFKTLTSQNCSYCGRSPSNVHKHPKYRGQYIYNGIDRVDNSVGYIFENCVTCCEQCNRAKLAHTVSDFKSWVVNVYNHWACK